MLLILVSSVPSKLTIIGGVCKVRFEIYPTVPFSPVQVSVDFPEVQIHFSLFSAPTLS